MLIHFKQLHIMKRMKLLTAIFLFVLIIHSCTKDDSSQASNQNEAHLKFNMKHNHFTSSDHDHNHDPETNAAEPFHEAIRFIDHEIYTTLHEILPEKFTQEEIEQLEQGYVWKYEEGDDIVYTIDYQYLDLSVQKLLVSMDHAHNIKSINIIETFIGSLNNSFSLHDVKLDSVKIYPLSDERSDGGRDGKSTYIDCLKIVFGDVPGGSTSTNDPSGGGTTISTGPGPTFGGGKTYTSGDYIFVIVCGCRPMHSGGNSNPECRCKKPDDLLIIKLPGTLHDNDNQSESRNSQKYWDCIEALIGCSMLNDYDLGILALKHCHSVYDVNDVDPQAGNDGSNQFIGPDFCDDWIDYQNECLNGSTSLSEVYQPWASFMIDYPELFFSTIEALPECTTTEEMEEIICVEEAYIALIETYDISPTPEVEAAIKEDAACGDDLVEKAKTIYENEYFTVEIDDAPQIDLKELFEDCFGEQDEDGNFIDCSNNEGVFTFTIYVDQPNPGTRDTYLGSIFGSDPIDAGHTFVSLSYNDGTTTNTVTYGLYPASGVTPKQPETYGAVVDNGGHTYDVAMTFDVSCSDFNTLMNQSLGLEGQNYDLNSNNCTDFGLGIANSIDSGIPDSKGIWGFWGGTNPGDLGEDLKEYSNDSATLINQPGIAPETNCN